MYVFWGGDVLRDGEGVAYFSEEALVRVFCVAVLSDVSVCVNC